MKGGMFFYRGSGAGGTRYFDEVHKGAEAYSDESRAAVQVDTWLAGERVATAVLTDRGALAAWVEGGAPATGEMKGAAGTGWRQALRFVEVVVSNPKSLSVLATQDPVVEAALEQTMARQADENLQVLLPGGGHQGRPAGGAGRGRRARGADGPRDLPGLA